MSIADFVARYLPNAQQVSAQTGLPVDFILAQSALETGAGQSHAATSLNNFFGISPGGTLANFADPQSGFDAYSGLINSRYSGASAFVGQGPLAIGDYLNANGYSTTPDYGSRVAGLVPAVDAALASVGASGGVSSGASAANPAGASARASCGYTDVGCWINSVRDLVGSALTRTSFIVVALLLIAGAIYMFATRTENTS